ncbi:MAG: diguanylate cyclase [Acidobacteriaceae bacterium]|nr:diguanylate cyclase [Acidobacteriaceae bacterium]
MQTLPISYSPWLIVASVAISIVAAYAAFGLADRMRAATTERLRMLWWLGGAGAMGTGIWSMHYLGMLAVQLPVPVLYHVPTVILSWMLAVVAAAVALQVVSAKRVTWMRLFAGGLAMGAGIGSMHYVGMHAMRMQAMHHYDNRMVAFSVVLAVSFSVLALWLATVVRNRQQHGAFNRALAGVVMGVAIASMHYTAMAGVTYDRCAMAYNTAWTVQISSLSEVVIILIVTLILIAAVGSAAVHQRQFVEMQDVQKDLLTTQQQLLKQQQDLLESQNKLVEVNARLAELSIRDALTGLHNRRHFDNMFDAEWRRAVRDHSSIALMVIDVDYFKALNDKRGHQTGDESLRRIAEVLATRPQRTHDVLVRYGGEEFAVLLPGADEIPAARFAEELRKSIEREAIEHGNSPVSDVVTVSIGVCSRIPADGDSAEKMLQDADAALYAAKENGRNRVVLAAAKREEYLMEGIAGETLVAKVYEENQPAEAAAEEKQTTKD